MRPPERPCLRAGFCHSLLLISDEPCDTPVATQRRWRISAASVLVVGAALRLYSLPLVPLHHDEGINGKFLLKLVNERLYQYDLQNYHGPMLYYFAALLFATKATAILSAVVLLTALVLTPLFVKLRELRERISKEPSATEKPRTIVDRLRSATERFGGPSSLIIASVAAVSLFLIIEIVFYSSFFSNYPNGLFDALKSLQFWTQTGEHVHVHPWFTYLSWMWQEESALLLLGLAGLGLALWRGANRFVIFMALCAVGMLAAYSLIPYKTPWLMLNFVVSMALTCGYALHEI